MSKPKVSVVMITYGHEEYIEESINGILTQNFDDEIELVISDDCSPDNTQSIIEKIIVDHPNGHWIKYIRQSKNKGAIPNFAWTIAQAKGKYIAICEGDDYWTNPLKLQKQVDFLENNKEYSLCFHRTDELYPNGEIKVSSYTKSDAHEKTFTLSDLFSGNFMHTPSVIFRNSISIPDWIKDAYIGDYIIWLCAAEKGKIKYLPDNMAIYRSGIGIWSSQDKEQMELKWMKSLAVIIMNVENPEIRNGLQQSFYNSSIRFMSSVYPSYLSLINQHIYKYYNDLSFSKLLKMTIKKVF
ncbi:glycosyltransferase family 2 protein [Chryseobacterium hagamense]|uniref:Glycosyl transferase n=1 Tax=Chryseobacterium hagamense TaxID=395935 RepID=A0A511YID8_9FLAO|nr:glycosyltransferase [Chryseobacterium hagamense]GEN74960.1 glycosyl transferase [Chryseobacterium hagamense]